MQRIVNILIAKFDNLAYFDIREVITPQQLQIIGEEIHQDPKEMTPQAREVFKIVKKYALAAEKKVKLGRKLYKNVSYNNQTVESIILNNSNLKSIEALESKQFKNLTQLQLASNKIRYLTSLKRCKMPLLQEVDLSSNFIETLIPLQEVFWPKIKILNLGKNNINSIEGLNLYEFRAIKIINLSDNFLKDIKWLRKVCTSQMISMKHLNLSNNEILDLKWLSECQFNKIEYLNLKNNKYGTFANIEKIKMSKDEIPGQRICISHYEIHVSSLALWSSYTVGYRQLSRHKQSLKIEPFHPRSNRQIIQKSRRLLLY